MQIKTNGSRTSREGQVEYFSGNVRIEQLFDAMEPTRAVGASVTFEPPYSALFY
jgi:hypothetical protein